MASRYLIPDEPRASGLSHLAVNPFWPLLAQMLCGSWLALPWFVFNGMALGSPSLRRETAAALASGFGCFALIHALDLAVRAQWLQGISIRLSLLSIVVLKAAMAYAMYMMQSRSFELWKYFGGAPRMALPVVFVGYLAKDRVLEFAHQAPLLNVALS